MPPRPRTLTPARQRHGILLLLGAALSLATWATRGSGPPLPDPDGLVAVVPDGRASDVDHSGALASAGSPAPQRVCVEAAATTEPAPDEGAPPCAVAAPTERAFLRQFDRLLRADPHALDRDIAALLLQPGPDCRRVALLRALWENHAAAAENAFVTAMLLLPDDASPRGVGVPSVARSYLTGRASFDPRAADLLTRLGLPAAATGRSFRDLSQEP